MTLEEYEEFLDPEKKEENKNLSFRDNLQKWMERLTNYDYSLDTKIVYKKVFMFPDWHL